MNRLLVLALALIWTSCASFHETARQAQIHQRLARQATEHDNYLRAAAEQLEADRLQAKAAREELDQKAQRTTVTGYSPH